MSLSGAMFTGVSGLGAISTAIQVIGDNIANQNTPGFKASRVQFADVLGRTITGAGGFSQVGAGTSVARVQPLFTQGTFENTSVNTDLAIEGAGMFVLDSAQGRHYTRVGVFNFDNQGLLVNADGERVQGFGIDPNTGLANGQLGDVAINNALAPPVATSAITTNLNLNASATAIPGGFDPANPVATANFTHLATVYDSLGNAQPVTLFFTKTGAGTWDWTAAMPPSATTTAPANPTDPFVVQGGGTLTFDTAGTMTAATGTTVNFQFAGGAAANQAITFDFGPLSAQTGSTTQFANSQSVVNAFTQDGSSAGTLVNLDIDDAGYVTGLFSNGSIVPLAQLALAQFPNLEELQAIGNNNYVETRGSGQPLVGAPQSGQFGSIRSSTIEQSNVDLAGEFVRLIIYQRGFQANTRTISTSNELLASLLQLGQ